MKKILLFLIMLFIPFMYVNAEGEAKYVASINDVKYSTLSEAINNAKDNDVIIILEDVNETSITISNNVTINGNGKNIDTTYLVVTGKLTIKNTILNIVGEGSQSILMNNYGAVFNILEGSKVTVTKKGILSVYDVTINVDNSLFTLKDISYVAWMQGQEKYKYATLNVTNGSTFRIDNVVKSNGAGGNGLNWVNTNVTNSKLFIENCEYQGIVAGSLKLNNSSASFKGNDYAHTLYRGEEITVDSNSSYDITETKTTGIWSWGGKITFKSGSKVNLTNNGNSKSNVSDEDVSNVSTGLNSSVIYLTSKTYSSLEIEDGAIANITNNYMRALANNGNAYIGNTTNIMNNGKVNPNYNKVSNIYGGGIFNSGILTIADGVNIYNNHAKDAGDDIYNTDGAVIDFKDVKDNWILDHCNDKINNWYDDSKNNRWNAHEDDLHIVVVESGVYEAKLELKAAHNLKAKVIAHYVDQDGNTISDDTVIEGFVDDEYKTKAKDITGYVLDKIEGVETGKMTIKDIHVTYIYEFVHGTGDIEEPVIKPEEKPTPDIPYTGIEEKNDNSTNVILMSSSLILFGGLVVLRKKIN